MIQIQMTAEEKLSRWEDQREIQNLMGRYTYELLLKNVRNIYDLFWTKTETPCLGFNNGYYKGENAVRGYYEDCHAAIETKGRLLAERFPEKLGALSADELHGAGQIDFKPLTSPYVIIAGDGKTAKGMWLAQGNYGDLLPTGPENFWTIGCFAGDFIREDESWRIMHLLYVEDVNTSMGAKWDAKREDPVLPEFAAAVAKLREPNHPACVRQSYSASRPFTELPPIPASYATFAETFSYGV